MEPIPGVIEFTPVFFERIWGGSRLAQRIGLNPPADKTIGEAWLLSDHAECESVVTSGPFEGETLGALLKRAPAAILGSHAPQTIHGRFPLLLKLIDSDQPLSVQVHPSDDDARRLGEPDVGKTEMWHILSADPGSELICGLEEGVTRDALARAIAEGSVEGLVRRFQVQSGDSVFVPAGRVHAIGAGIVLAEIQQNSNITYRLYDWGRLQADGTARTLHVDKSLEVAAFASSKGGKLTPLGYDRAGARCALLAACRYFAAEEVCVSGHLTRETGGTSFHIMLLKSGRIQVAAMGAGAPLRPGHAILMAGQASVLEMTGEGELLEYYVPVMEQDIVVPLRAAGHSDRAIEALGQRF
ncbi:MAG TPA: class I mannose-6-phosphate isomerase [Candidatus Hydrogenedentes bacterium]|nr:class I mannose-6-phosphate isomerase [Candidatus Hydrogenedentota bacterium]HPG66667.1 class I mannose-6-phosphate isomerase [Candidatus Hydrogenedentota bacterium]